jgi:hypothetical protein
MSAATEPFGSRFSMVNARVTLPPGGIRSGVNALVRVTGPVARDLSPAADLGRIREAPFRPEFLA